MALRIIDVSSNNGYPLNWPAVAQAGITAGFTKLTEGAGYYDWTAPANAAGIRAHLGALGYYHFARPDLHNSPQQEAQYFLDHLPELEPGTLLALDLEVPTAGAGALDDFALAWLRYVEQQTGVRPLVYTGAWFASGLGRLRAPELGQYHLWDAAYQPQQPPAYAPWSAITIWQHTNVLAIAGVGLADESYFSGSLADLRALGKPAPKAPPPKPAYPEAGKHLRLTVATHLRPRPALDAMPLGRLLPIGTQVVELQPPRGWPIETTSWAWVRTSGDVQGYVYKPDTVPYTP